MAKSLGLAARIARELGVEAGGESAPRKFERREWEIQDDGQLLNTQTGEVRTALDEFAEIAPPSGFDDDQGGGFDEDSQVARGYEERSGGASRRVEKLPLPGAWKGAGKPRAEKVVAARRR